MVRGCLHPGLLVWVGCFVILGLWSPLGVVLGLVWLPLRFMWSFWPESFEAWFLFSSGFYEFNKVGSVGVSSVPNSIGGSLDLSGDQGADISL